MAVDSELVGVLVLWTGVRVLRQGQGGKAKEAKQLDHGRRGEGLRYGEVVVDATSSSA